ncbi:hypothetical protein NOR_02240 [Metarhizium rileyi]|uniref:Homeodomain-like protein n=1 Tax=Metarhizium rileyi (strain RCEF 4871) TaxID=1649241 RepID=A0A162LZU7_METRR|nr:hypothetical protein NOR_02240 [Metarhizium rileyi RCEF 4871]TWU76485.1 hypothetical protein ED733_007328 [Metarhizium rileyi]
MDSDEGYSVDEDSVADYDSHNAYSELRGSTEIHERVNQDDRESSYAPSDRSLNLRAKHELFEVDDAGNRTPPKRSAEQLPACRPFKRQKGVLNAEYLDLLNRGIDDAAHRVCLEESINCPHSQLGLTSWSTVEKHQLFESVSRLGKYDLLGIAGRIGSKSEVEIKQYLDMLQAEKESRQRNHRSYLELAEYPAAVEISQQCCHAQEEAADTVSIRQERREEQREELKWGDNWDITLSLARRLGHGGEDADSASEATVRFAQLFHLSNWLRLSGRVFMNSSIPGNNWNYVDDKRPSIWATAFDDFYSLAVSVTRRLVQTTLFISMSRIRAKKELIPTTRDIVRRKDVEAAIASLGMSHNANDLWIRCARRLRLDVFDEPPDKDEEEAEEEPMTYAEVEAVLSGDADRGETQALPEAALSAPEASSDEDVEEEEECKDDTGSDWEPDTREGGEDDEDEDEKREIEHEANEVLVYSAPELRDVRTAKQALRLRVAMERKQEAQAELHDEYASCQAEIEMWNILQKKPPMEVPRVQDPGRVRRSNMDVENVYPLGRDWASKLEYLGEWESLDAPGLGE